MDEKIMNELISDAFDRNLNRNAQMNRFFDYHRGDHDILKTLAGTGKPNNKLVFNFAELIIATNHSYLFSKPQSYDYKYRQESWIKKIFSKDKVETLTGEFLQDVKVIYFDNNEEGTTSKLGKKAAIAGEAVELHYIDTDGNIRFTETDARDWVFFSYEGEDFAARRLKREEYRREGQSIEKVEVEYVEVYTKDTITEYELTEQGYKLNNEQQHFYGEIPVIRFFNGDKIEGKDTVSDLKNVVALNDAYNLANSSSLNNLNYNGDPYLITRNFTFDDEQIENFKDTRIIEVLGDDASIDFLQWNQETKGYESFLDRVERDLFILSFTPDLFSKENSRTSDSGVSLKMKFIGADLKADAKIRSFITGFRKRLKLIAKQLENKTNKTYFTDGIYRNIDITFNKNLPQNLKETVEMVNLLAGSVSEETRMKLLPFVDNSKEEMERMKKEQGLSTSTLFGDDPNERV